jgi:16S rRNA (adenine1518-N6/adenine1519-N6)-dimethyltransferase
LTEGLVECAGKVIAVEFDRDMITVLRERYGRNVKFALIDDDFLNVDLHLLAAGREKKLVGNLPYNISTPILQKLIDDRDLFSCMVLMFQREVADRIAATPGGRERGYLSVLVENAFTAERLFDVPPTAFQPVPKVWSTVVRLTPKISPITDDARFRNMVSAAFAQKRKTILNNLKLHSGDAAAALDAAHIHGSRRAETLTLDEWARLGETLEKKPGIK